MGRGGDGVELFFFFRLPVCLALYENVIESEFTFGPEHENRK